MPLQQGTIAREWLCLELRYPLSMPFETMCILLGNHTTLTKKAIL